MRVRVRVEKSMIQFEYLYTFFARKHRTKKVYVAPEVYVPLQDNLSLSDIAPMFVEEFYLFLHYKQEKYLRVLMEIPAQMCSSLQMTLWLPFIRLVLFYIYISLYMTLDSQTKGKKTMVLLCNVRMCINITKCFICWLRTGWYSFTSNRSHTKKCTHAPWRDLQVGKQILLLCLWEESFPLWWRHNDRDGVWDHQPHDCLLNRLFRRRSKKTSKLRVTDLCAGNSPGTGEFPAQRASNAENVSIWWRHHAILHFKQHWYTGVLLQWVLEVANCLLMKILCLKWKINNDYLFSFSYCH